MYRFLINLKFARQITSGEYIQMSGRAGRRGIDARGIAIIMAREKMDPTIVKGIITVRYYFGL